MSASVCIYRTNCLCVHECVPVWENIPAADTSISIPNVPPHMELVFVCVCVCVHVRAHIEDELLNILHTLTQNCKE